MMKRQLDNKDDNTHNVHENNDSKRLRLGILPMIDTGEDVTVQIQHMQEHWRRVQSLESMLQRNHLQTINAVVDLLTKSQQFAFLEKTIAFLSTTDAGEMKHRKNIDEDEDEAEVEEVTRKKLLLATGSQNGTDKKAEKEKGMAVQQEKGEEERAQEEKAKGEKAKEEEKSQKRRGR